MRGLAACLVGLVGLGALATMAACSDSTDGGSGGAGGSSAAAGSGGKASSGGSTSQAGSGGAAECGFQSVACSTCLGEKCDAETTACSDIDDCATALYMLANSCVCDPQKDPAKCISDFVDANGDPAKDLATCFNTNCSDVCKSVEPTEGSLRRATRAQRARSLPVFFGGGFLDLIDERTRAVRIRTSRRRRLTAARRI